MQDNDASDGLYSLLSLDQKRESEDFIFRRPLSESNNGFIQQLIVLNTVHRLGKQQANSCVI